MEEKLNIESEQTHNVIKNYEEYWMEERDYEDYLI